MVDDDLDVLVVDDSEGYRDLYSLWLAPDYTVRAAPDGSAALAELDGRIDIVLLDRQLPGPNGLDVAQSIDGSAHDPFVVMVSSLRPDFDLIEQPVDEYLQKPIEEADIREVVETYRAQQAYLRAVDEMYRLQAQVATLEAHKSDAELADSEEYARLQERLAEKRGDVQEAMVEAQADWETTFRACTKDIGTTFSSSDRPNGLG